MFSSADAKPIHGAADACRLSKMYKTSLLINSNTLDVINKLLIKECVVLMTLSVSMWDYGILWSRIVKPGWQHHSSVRV